MSYSYALPGERFSSGLSRRWLVACTLSQLICLGALEAGGVLAQRMQWLTGSPEKIALDLVTAAIFGLTYGYLRGNVLRTGLARFPMALWCLVAAALALVFTPPVPEFAVNFLPASGASAAARVLSPFAINGLIYGLVVGGLEALVMRMRAADGVAIADRRHLFSTYPRCFVGSEAVEWLVRHEDLSRGEALQLGQRLVERGIIHHVLDEHPFRDGAFFYRFYADERRGNEASGKDQAAAGTLERIR